MGLPFQRTQGQSLQLAVGVQLGNGRVIGAVNGKRSPAADVVPAELLGQRHRLFGGASFIQRVFGGGIGIQTVTGLCGFCSGKHTDICGEAFQLQPLAGQLFQPGLCGNNVISRTGRKPINALFFHKIRSFPVVNPSDFGQSASASGSSR